MAIALELFLAQKLTGNKDISYKDAVVNVSFVDGHAAYIKIFYKPSLPNGDAPFAYDTVNIPSSYNYQNAPTKFPLPRNFFRFKFERLGLFIGLASFGLALLLPACKPRNCKRCCSPARRSPQ